MSARTSRYDTLIPMDRLCSYDHVVVGVGAIGRQVALLLAAMGIEKLVIIDPDTVEEANMGAQGYRPDQVRQLKVVAMTEDLRAINPELRVEPHNRKFEPGDTDNRCIVYACADSMDCRKQIYTSAQWALMIDARMAAEYCEVHIIDPDDKGWYRGTLFSQEEAYQDSCTAKSTYYCASLAASIMVAQVSKWIRGIPTDHTFEMNLLDLCSTMK